MRTIKEIREEYYIMKSIAESPTLITTAKIPIVGRMFGMVWVCGFERPEEFEAWLASNESDGGNSATSGGG